LTREYKNLVLRIPPQSSLPTGLPPTAGNGTSTHRVSHHLRRRSSVSNSPISQFRQKKGGKRKRKTKFKIGELCHHNV
ncbi:hypothetical protein TSUD_176660, partial [Trifolium subterraneum]